MVDTSLAKVEGELVATMEAEESSLSDDIPFHLLLIGDWSGRANRRESASGKEFKTTRPLLVDRDNLDQLIAELGVQLGIALASGDPPLTVNFNELEDFHPDRLFNRLEIFAGLRRTRAELEDVERFSAAAARVRNWEEAPPPAKPEAIVVSKEPAPEKIPEGNILDRILAADPQTSSAENDNQAEVSAEIYELAKAAAQPHLTPDIERDQEQLIATIDARIEAAMNAILHHPDFQALESAWRALDFLVRRLETGPNLKLYLLDLSFDEFKADLRGHDDFRSTALCKLLVEDALTLGGTPWSVVGGNYLFDFDGGDADVVESIAAISEASGAPFVAGVNSELLGCQSLAATPDPDDWRPVDTTTEDWWKRITHLSSADYVGFVLPRFLLRLPYGKASEPTEDFEFEELGSIGDESPAHESYLWANPAFAVVFLLARGFIEDGPEFRPADHLEIEGLPMHVYEQSGATEIKPGAEVLLTLRAAERIIDRGLMPLLSIKNSDRIRLGMCQSIAGTGLAGRWFTNREG